MPIYVYSCPNDHVTEVFRDKPMTRRRRRRCKKCGLYQTRDIQREHGKRGKDLHLSYEHDPVSHLIKHRSFKGVTLENLTPEPVRVTSKAQYDRLLKSTHSMEKESGYSG